MKKIYLLCLFATTFSIGSTAQCTIVNSGFENWTTRTGNSLIGGFPYSFEEPTQTFYSNDDHLNYFVFGTGPAVLNKTTDKNSGTYALKMIVLANTTSSMYGIGQVTYAPAKLSGYYKFNGLTKDSMEIFISIVDDSLTRKVAYRDTANMIAYGRGVMKSNVSTYTYFSIPLITTSTVLPDSFHIGFYAYNHNSSGLNIFLDDICFEAQTGVVESKNEIKCNFYNTKNDHFALKLSLEKPAANNITAVIFDIAGREVYKEQLSTQGMQDFSNEMNLCKLNRGIYFLQLQGKDVLLSKKFLVE